jgi:ectoine hydroxylase-related dioxygenase (phytanoyl-CoA dioxygenase family)
MNQMHAVRDLAECHEPIGDLFRTPEDWAGFRLSDQQVAHFDEHGFLPGVRVLNDTQVEALTAALARLTDPGHPGHEYFYEFHCNESHNAATVLFHALGAWRIEVPFHDILWNPAFIVPASQLLRGPVRFWHDQLFCKPANHGGVVAWHQDYSYWTRTEPLAHLTCWMALDDSTVENGCVYYVPGSHKWNLLPITGLTGDMNEIKTVLTEEQKSAFHPVPVELKRGQAVFHHALTVHGSYENRSPRQRRATLINAFRDGVRSSRNDAPLEGVPPVPAGQPMGGKFFPLLGSGDGA